MPRITYEHLSKPVLYVIVRTDLSKSSPAVQAGHAVAQWLIEFSHAKWDNETLVYLRARDEQVLSAHLFDAQQNGKLVAKFYEPDLGMQLTAIAVLGEDSMRMSDYPMLTLL